MTTKLVVFVLKSKLKEACVCFYLMTEFSCEKLALLKQMLRHIDISFTFSPSS